MGWVLSSVTRPTLDLDLIKTHCRIPTDWEGDDSLLTRYMNSAFIEVEKASERYLGKATATYMGPANCATDDGLYMVFETRKIVPLRAEDGQDIERAGITSIEYRGLDEAWHAFDETDYVLEEVGVEPARILVAMGVTSNFDPNYRFPYKIVTTIGYEAADLPDAAAQAALMLIAEYYRCREVFEIGKSATMFKTAWDQQIRNLQWRFKG